MPSQPLWPSVFMNARRLGVSTICAMFSRVTSKTSGSSLASRNASTSARNANCSGANSKSMVAPTLSDEASESVDGPGSSVPRLGMPLRFAAQVSQGRPASVAERAARQGLGGGLFEAGSDGAELGGRLRQGLVVAGQTGFGAPEARSRPQLLGGRGAHLADPSGRLGLAAGRRQVGGDRPEVRRVAVRGHGPGGV